MGQIHVFTGGARSGKSTMAQQKAMGQPDVAYVATAINTDAEMENRIAEHVRNRPAEWKTYECPYDIATTLRQTSHALYLIDCITVFVTNLIIEKIGNVPEQEQTADLLLEAETHVGRAIDAIIDAMRQKDAIFIVVTNEVGMGVVPAGALSRVFRDAAGRANQKLAQAAQNVTLMVSGLPLQLKGTL